MSGFSDGGDALRICELEEELIERQVSLSLATRPQALGEDAHLR